VQATVWLNTEKYSIAEFLLLGVGGTFWVILYVTILISIRKKRFVEIPAICMVANASWDALWAFCFRNDLGELFIWGYRSWIILDIFVIWALFRIGPGQTKDPVLRQWYRPLLVSATVIWLLLTYFFTAQGYETPTGMTWGYLVVLLMAALYLVNFLREGDHRKFSYLVAWSKLIGNGFGSGFCFLAYPDVHFLLSLCVITFVLDVAYIVLYHWRKKVEVAAVAAAA